MRKQKRKRKPVNVIFPPTILVDTSEQLPYTFRNILSDADTDNLPYIVRTERANLKATGGGDYSIAGVEKLFSVERKNPSDFLSSLTRGRLNFEAEISRLHTGFLRSFVVVEAEWSELVEEWIPRTAIRAKSIIRTVTSWQLRYPMVNWWFVPGRRAGEVQTFSILKFVYQMAVSMDYLK